MKPARRGGAQQPRAARQRRVEGPRLRARAQHDRRGPVRDDARQREEPRRAAHVARAQRVGPVADHRARRRLAGRSLRRAAVSRRRRARTPRRSARARARHAPIIARGRRPSVQRRSASAARAPLALGRCPRSARSRCRRRARLPRDAARSRAASPPKGAPRCPRVPARQPLEPARRRAAGRDDSDRLVRSIGLDAPCTPTSARASTRAGRSASRTRPCRGASARCACRSTTRTSPTAAATRSRATRRSRAAAASDGDRHVIVVDRDRCRLYELYAAYPAGRRQRAGAPARARSGACARTGCARAAGPRPTPPGCRSCPGLARYEEVRRGEIDHALRFTAPRTRARVRLPRAPLRVELRRPGPAADGAARAAAGELRHLGLPAPVARGPRALKRYGMILADNGSPWYISGAPSRGWNNDDLHELGACRAATSRSSTRPRCRAPAGSPLLARLPESSAYIAAAARSCALRAGSSRTSSPTRIRRRARCRRAGRRGRRGPSARPAASASRGGCTGRTAAAHALDLADGEAPADEVVQRDAAGDDVAPASPRRELDARLAREPLDRLGLDQRDVPAVARGSSENVPSPPKYRSPSRPWPATAAPPRPPWAVARLWRDVDGLDRSRLHAYKASSPRTPLSSRTWTIRW